MNTSLTKGLGSLLIVLLCAACSTSPSGISISDAWARPTTAMDAAKPTAAMTEGMTKTTTMNNAMMDGPVSAIYMVIQNNSATADRLMSANTDVSEVTEIHETKQMEGGMMGMQPIQGGLEVPANGSVTLKPGSYHIMLMKLKKDLTPGLNIKLTLKFQSGKEISMDVPVKQMQQ